MKAPKTYFSTELHTGRTALRRRLSDLFAAPRRVGVLPLVCILLLVSMLGSLVACDTGTAQTTPAPAESEEDPALSGQVWEGVDVPDAVLAAAESYVWDQYVYWSENSGAVGMVDGEMEMIGQPADYDDWRIESMELTYHYDGLEGVTLDVYRLGWRLHTTTPDQVLLAGGMEMDEDGWVLATYPNSTYLIFDVGAEEPVYLFSSMVNDCEPGSELFTETIRRPLQWALLQDEAETAARAYLSTQHPEQQVQLASLTFQQEISAPPQTVCAVYETEYLLDVDGKWVSMPLDLADGEHYYLVLAYTGEGREILGGFNARPGTYSRQAEALSWGLSDTDFALLWQGGGWYGLGGSASHLLHEGVVLIGADEQGAGKGVKAVLGGILGRGVKPEGIAGSAAVVPAGQGGKEGPQAVLVHFDEPDADGLKIRPGGIPAGPVFSKGMDVGVIPEGYGLQALFPELLNAGNGARGATNVQQ